MSRVVVVSLTPTRRGSSTERRIAESLTQGLREPVDVFHWSDWVGRRAADGRPAAVLVFPTAGRLAANAERHARESYPGLGTANGSRRPTRLVRLGDAIANDPSIGGALTNEPGPLSAFGRKDTLEFILRGHARAGGRRVDRPLTFVADASQAALAIAHFQRTGQHCIVKPAAKARGEGIRVLAPGSRPPALNATVVVQELLDNVLRADRRKVDFRVYLLVDPRDRAGCRRLGPILVRPAPDRYVRGRVRSEITNSSYRRRLGLRPLIRPLEEVLAWGARQRNAIETTLDGLAARLLDAVIWWSTKQRRTRKGSVLLLWGIDMAVVKDGRRLSARLLEVNPYPQLLRGEPASDAAVLRMFREEVSEEIRSRIEGFA